MSTSSYATKHAVFIFNYIFNVNLVRLIKLVEISCFTQLWLHCAAFSALNNSPRPKVPVSSPVNSLLSCCDTFRLFKLLTKRNTKAVILTWFRVPHFEGHAVFSLIKPSYSSSHIHDRRDEWRQLVFICHRRLVTSANVQTRNSVIMAAIKLYCPLIRNLSVDLSHYCCTKKEESTFLN